MEKIVKQLALLSPDDVFYSGYRKIAFLAPVHKVHLDPSLFRKFICVDGCTACCLKFTLDYTQEEYAVYGFEDDGFHLRTISVNDRVKSVWTNDQNANPLCDFLKAKREGGGLGCSRWPHAPLSCASAPQFQVRQFLEGETSVFKGPFKSAHTMSPRPQCQFHAIEIEDFESELEDLITILERFSGWARYLNIHTVLPEMADIIMDCYLRGVVPLREQTIIL